ncbi:MAG: DUF447 family protein [Bacteroidales bacterium]|nr:DUF447 family protein [Bacteroidales bacterium]
MILEALITTTNRDGSPHLAPMGPQLDSATPRQFLLKPFLTSQTYQNLCHHPEGVLHITDDAALIARSAIGMMDPFPPVRPASLVRGWVLTDCCRHQEFRVTHVDAAEPRVRMHCEIVHSTTHRDFWGFNRAKHALLEAAILATRLHLLPTEDVEAEYHKLRVIVDKTGGPAEQEGMHILEDYLARHRAGGAA